jgi:hypothetical protein
MEEIIKQRRRKKANKSQDKWPFSILRHSEENKSIQADITSGFFENKQTE